MEVIKIKDYEIGYSDQFFFDTNVWILLYGTFSDYQEYDQRQYSKLLNELLSKDKPIFLTSMILSEFSNVMLKRDFNQWVSTNKLVNQKFKKDFVGTSEYENSVETITIAINKILKLPNLMIIGDSFNSLDKQNILHNFKIVDFNDSYIAELAYNNNYKIVTNDRDFSKLNTKLKILTS